MRKRQTLLRSIALALLFLLWGTVGWGQELDKVRDHFRLKQALSLAGNPDMKLELELVDEQVDKIRELVNEYSKSSDKISEEYHILIAKESTEDRDAVASRALKTQREAYAKLNQNLLKVLNKLLLPQQSQRFNQLALQKQLEFEFKGDRIGMFVGLAERLKLSEKERKEFERKVDLAKKSYLEEAKKLQDKLDKELADALPERAREGFKKLIGDLYGSR